MARTNFQDSLDKYLQEANEQAVRDLAIRVSTVVGWRKFGFSVEVKDRKPEKPSTPAPSTDAKPAATMPLLDPLDDAPVPGKAPTGSAANARAIGDESVSG